MSSAVCAPHAVLTVAFSNACRERLVALRSEHSPWPFVRSVGGELQRSGKLEEAVTAMRDAAAASPSLAGDAYFQVGRRAHTHTHVYAQL